MALCVLLADESATIKKVMQITLQDYDAEIRCVSLGTDVLNVAKDIEPDIVFIDILLQKKSGYEVAKELKSDPDCNKIPVIMLWNGFMEFDEAKFQDSLADGKLEKPFDSETLRKLIAQYVKKAQANPVAEHIQPPPVEWEEEKTMDDEATNALPPQPKPQPSSQEPEGEKEASWNMEQFDDLPSLDALEENLEEDDNFQPVKLNELGKDENTQSNDNESISRFTLDIPKEDLGEFDLNDNEEENFEQIDTSNFLWGNEVDLEAKEDSDTGPAETASEPEEKALAPETSSKSNEVIEKNLQATEQAAKQTPPTIDAKPEISEAELEAYVRQHCQETIEKLARQMVPDMAKEIIQKELDRLLKEEEANTQ